MRKVVLIGDSIRMGYEPIVREILSGSTEVWGAKENGGDSRRVLARLDEWVIGNPADVVHFNCGLHDLKVTEDGSHQVPIDEYRKNLKDIIERLQTETDAKLIWATITPVIDERHAREKEFIRRQADVETFNQAALEIVNKAELIVNDLHGIIESNGVETCISRDGVHMTEHGSRVLAEAVAGTMMA